MIAALLLFFALVDYRLALPGYRYEFPRDHFSHTEFRTEWWYYTGNVHTATGHRYGFELVFFRSGADDRSSSSVKGDGDGPWRIDNLYLAHLALTDIDSQKFLYRRRLNRAGPGIAGIDSDARRIWNGNWQCQWDAADRQTLTAVADGIRFTLQLTPQTPPVIHGENGVSQKADGPGKASHYVSFPRLDVSGTLNGAAVSGAAWMDHEWFTQQLDPNQQGWDWFSVQLENRTELMLFDLRRTDGSIDSHSSGTYVDAGGRARHLRDTDFRLEPIERWTSSKTHATYPIRWRITVPSLNLSLECIAAIPNQELVSEDTAPSYWEGAVTYSGTVKGAGYLEMTGYAGRPQF